MLSPTKVREVNTIKRQSSFEIKDGSKEHRFSMNNVLLLDTTVHFHATI